jgi:hypothetical protein
MDDQGKRTSHGCLVRFLASAVVVVFVLVVGELLVRFVSPRPSLYPRWEVSAEYGNLLHPSRTMIHERPGRWRFTYTTNANRCRGDLVPITNSYGTRNIVVLGDSSTFGQGVNDGEEYAAVLGDLLGDEYAVVNLGVAGWGLGQEIRRFYEFGRLYDPELVVLQYSNNDPKDNFRYKVTIIEDGRFKFLRAQPRLGRLKRFLSNSIIQKSQLYNLFRDPIYQLALEGATDRRIQTAAQRDASGTSVEEVFYGELLELFAADLAGRGVRLIMIARGEDLAERPEIRRAIDELEAVGALKLHDVQEWFAGEENLASPEGHKWGAKAHRIIGERLAQMLTAGRPAVSRDVAPRGLSPSLE